MKQNPTTRGQQKSIREKSKAALRCIMRGTELTTIERGQQPLAPFPPGTRTEVGAKRAHIYGGIAPDFSAKIGQNQGGLRETGVSSSVLSDFHPHFRGSVTVKSRVFPKEAKVSFLNVALLSRL